MLAEPSYDGRGELRWRSDVGQTRQERTGSADLEGRSDPARGCVSLRGADRQRGLYLRNFIPFARVAPQTSSDGPSSTLGRKIAARGGPAAKISPMLCCRRLKDVTSERRTQEASRWPVGESHVNLTLRRGSGISRRGCFLCAIGI